MSSFIQKIKLYIFTAATVAFLPLSADNQTPTFSDIKPGSELPFQISIELADFALPSGIHSFVYAIHDDKWLLLCGRTNGLHGFGDNPNNFPPDAQNQVVYVVDPNKGKVYSRSLASSKSGLTQDQIDSLAVTSPQFYQSGNRLYITGGYAYRNLIQNWTTFDSLTAINVSGLMKWVITGRGSAAQHIRQIFDPVFKVTGGGMDKLGKREPTLLTFGQDFEGAYEYGVQSQEYTMQVRRFHIIDDGIRLGVKILETLPIETNDDFRRRDLNVVKVLSRKSGSLRQCLVALSGVFTLTTGVWTVPVSVNQEGVPFEQDPSSPNTFKQGMNNYACAVAGLYSKKTRDMYMVLLGGLTAEVFENGMFVPDADIPFTNQVTTVRVDRTGLFSQYFMEGQEYPLIRSTQSNPGNPLLFGTNAAFIPTGHEIVPEVLDFDKVGRSGIVGYIVGGIQSTLDDTQSPSDSAASPYIFALRIISNSNESRSSSH